MPPAGNWQGARQYRPLRGFGLFFPWRVFFKGDAVLLLSIARLLLRQIFHSFKFPQSRGGLFPATKSMGTRQRHGLWIFITRTAFDAYVTVPPNVTGQDEAGRLWDIVWMLRFAIRKATPGQTRLPFALYVRNDNRRARLVKLIAACGPLDMDDPQPAIVVMMPDED